MLEFWPVIRSRQGESNSIFSVRIDTARAPRSGKEHDFYVLDSVDWVNIIPLTRDKQIVMVKQFRHGTKEITLEIPGGMVEKKDTPEKAAARELLEETGYQAENLRLLGMAHPNPAIQNNRCFTYLAENIQKVSEVQLDETEDIEVMMVPIQQIPNFFRNGTITHSLVITAFHWYYLNELNFPTFT